jgi:hypothetical protein
MAEVVRLRARRPGAVDAEEQGALPLADALRAIGVLASAPRDGARKRFPRSIGKGKRSRAAAGRAQVFEDLAAASARTIELLTAIARAIDTAERTLGLEPGAFLDLYRAWRAGELADALQDPIVRLARQLPEPIWEGTAAALLGRFNAMASDAERASQRWPRQPNALAIALRKLSRQLRQAGDTSLSIRFLRATDASRQRLVRISRG